MASLMTTGLRHVNGMTGTGMHLWLPVTCCEAGSRRVGLIQVG